MNVELEKPLAERPNWHPTPPYRRLGLGTLALSAAQLAAFWWFAQTPPAPPRPSRGSGATVPTAPTDRIWLAVDGLREAHQWVPKPRRFLENNLSVSASSPVRKPRRDQTKPSWSTPPKFLPSDATPAPAVLLIPRPLAEPIDREAPPPATPATSPLTLTQNLVVVVGPLRARGFTRPPVIPPWSGPEAIGATRIDVSVNADGEILLARVSGSSGAKAADDAGLAAVRSARFGSIAQPPPLLAQTFDANTLVRGTIIIRWQANPAPSLP